MAGREVSTKQIKDLAQLVSNFGCQLGHSGHRPGVRDQDGTQSAISVERCPPSRWNAVRHHGGMLSAIRAERCPGWRGIRRSARPGPRRGGARSWPPGPRRRRPTAGRRRCGHQRANDREAQPRPSITFRGIGNRLQFKAPDTATPAVRLDWREGYGASSSSATCILRGYLASLVQRDRS